MAQVLSDIASCAASDVSGEVNTHSRLLLVCAGWVLPDGLSGAGHYWEPSRVFSEDILHFSRSLLFPFLAF